MSKQLHELSDEELIALSPDQIAAMTSDESTTEEEDPHAAQAAASTANQGDSEEEAGDEVDDATQDAQADGAETDAGEPAQATQDPATNAVAADVDTGDKAGTDKDKPANPAPAADGTPADAAALKDFHARITAPFKANGREMQVQNPEEAIQLMQMGANYNRKMQAMKPHLATLRMLENAGIKEEELNFLIDVHRKNPAAINKLVKDSGIDPLDLSADKADGYRPNDHTPHESEVALDIVIRDLDGSPGLPRVMDVVANQWDAKSKQAIAQNPDVIRGLTHHVEAGWFDQVMAVVDRERTLGRLTGLPDLEAYRQVGDAMAANGAFAQSGAGQPSRQQTSVAPAVVPAKPKQADDSDRNEKRRSAAPARSAPATNKTDADFNPLSLSDEEFMKQFHRKI